MKRYRVQLPTARGIAQAIIADLERRARSLGLTELVLLTRAAREFFELRGYRVIARASAPTGVQQSEEFRSMCPQSATCMAKKL